MTKQDLSNKALAEELMQRFHFSREDLKKVGNKGFEYEVPFYAEVCKVREFDIILAVLYVRNGGKTDTKNYITIPKKNKNEGRRNYYV